jgi:hypothetical protein
MLQRTAQTNSHCHADRGFDVNATPRVAVEALLAAEPLPELIYEPAAGPGAIVTVLREHGHAIIASDLLAFEGLSFVADFFDVNVAPSGVSAIVTNPPYKIADAVARHALTLTADVFLLLRLAFLESARRTDLIDHSGLRTVLPFRSRLPMMHRSNWCGARSTSAVPYAWFHWRRGHRGPPAIIRI